MRSWRHGGAWIVSLVLVCALAGFGQQQPSPAPGLAACAGAPVALVENLTAGTRNGTFLIWKGGQPADFKLKLEIKLEGIKADSGIQYRASVSPPGQGRAGAAPPHAAAGRVTA
jgi:hypothetical protein